ncbi:MAG: phosphonate C-P lyase system protein PhnL [Desulfobacterales bacterium]|jgi:alpha-D-ribose 1-methylphosphonate 5-triphosphate synthase subunit PhnL
MESILKIDGLTKHFRLHTQGGTRIPVFDGLALELFPGESAAVCGPSGVGKSTLLRLIYGNYRIGGGRIRLRHRGTVVDLADAPAHLILDVRRWSVGYVSQFLRVIPRVPTLDIVMEPLLQRGTALAEARRRARALLEQLRIPPRLWPLSPTTFSGGEQQRVNIARGFAAFYPIMLLDEPTASLDPANRQTVLDLIAAARRRGAATLSIFHDPADREATTSRAIALAAA